MNDPVVQEIDMEPGGVLVVGPRGRFTMHRHASGKICVQAVHCDFVGPEGMSRAHKALVNERWALRTEDGLPILSEIQRHELELAQERDKPEKRTEVAEKAQGPSVARSEGASDLRCPPCNGNCRQGRDCPARGEFSKLGRGPAAWHLVWLAAGLGLWGMMAWLAV